MSTFASAAFVGLAAVHETTTATGNATAAARSAGFSNETIALWVVTGLVIAVVAFAIYEA